MDQLTNTHASPEAVRLYQFLLDNYGKMILTGQHTKTREQPELRYIEEATGKLPALCGFELLGYSPNVNYTDTDADCITEVMENGNTIDTALAWARRGGIVTYCWHWFSPMRGHNKSFYTKYTDYDLSVGMTEGTPEHTALLRDIDLIAEPLKRLRDAGVPVLWRPLHEADGGWFWWGAKGPEPCKALWRLMYARMTQEHQLNNLIWVWNSASPNWYPGDDCVDILSRDVYAGAGEDRPLQAEYEELRRVSDRKMLALAENGTVPDLTATAQAGGLWSYYMTWCGSFVSSDTYTSKDKLRAAYQSPYALTLEDLDI